MMDPRATTSVPPPSDAPPSRPAERITRAILHGLSLLLGIAWCAWTAGCGNGSLSGTAPEPQVDVLFIEDVEPAVAALPYDEDSILIQPYSGADRAALAELYRAVGAEIAGSVAELGAVSLRVRPDRLVDAGETLAASGLVESVQKNYLFETTRVPDDPLYADQAHLESIHAPAAWDATTGTEGAVIAIVDTGIDRDHPDLAEKISNGWSISDDDGEFDDDHGHGTAVAGVAAAMSNNAIGVTGVSWNSKLLAVQVADEFGQSSSQRIAAGILWASANGARVINVSFAPLFADRLVRSAAQHAQNRGSLVVISAGNGGGVSASRGYAEALFVGALVGVERLAPFSDRGPFVDLVAPGVAIRSTFIGGEYGFVDGTSFAAPVVSGVAALCWSIRPELRPVTIRDVLLNTAVDLPPTGKDVLYGYGIVDAGAAVAEAQRRTFEPDDAAPTLSVIRPLDGSSISGRYLAIIDARDRWGVADVVLHVDGIAYATDTNAPYRFVLDTAQWSEGPHELSFVATDLAGNVSMGRRVSVTFHRPGRSAGGRSSQIQFTDAPASISAGARVHLRATVSDADGLATVEWLIDGATVHVAALTGQESGISYVWQAPLKGTGTHVFTVVVTDVSGQRTSADVTVTVR